MNRFIVPWSLVLVLVGGLSTPRETLAQGPEIPDEPTALSPGSENSSLGRSPGAGGQIFSSPGTNDQMLGGRIGPSVPRVPQSATMPGQAPALLDHGVIGRVPVLEPAEVPQYGLLKLPREEDEGPPGGMTLDQAIDQMVHANLDLRGKFYEIPQAEADILTASLRANPLIYADSQLIPYGQYSRTRPGGPLQYDLNITYPLDVTRKRIARTAVATQAKRVLQAQYQDAVRVQIDNLYTLWVDVLNARENLRAANAAVAGLEDLAAKVDVRLRENAIMQAEANTARIQVESARIAVADFELAERRAHQNLATILNLPPTESSSLQIRGTIRNQTGNPPPTEELIGLALAARPDVIAFRLGIQRASADVKLAEANRLSDVYVLYQPYTFQDNTPYGTKSTTSWAIGVTVPLPIYNRNQGNIQRAHLNVAQTQTELANLERMVATEVQQAASEYSVSRQAVDRILTSLIPRAEQSLSLYRLQYEKGQRDPLIYLNDIKSSNDVVRQALGALIRHRRAMLDLNTAVGRRILP
ncbi:MAG: TolC family protein [Isosphaeraceae bacterium]